MLNFVGDCLCLGVRLFVSSAFSCLAFVCCLVCFLFCFVCPLNCLPFLSCLILIATIVISSHCLGTNKDNTSPPCSAFFSNPNFHSGTAFAFGKGPARCIGLPCLACPVVSCPVVVFACPVLCLCVYCLC